MEMERRQPQRTQGPPPMTRRLFCARICAALLFAVASDDVRAQADQGFQDFLQSLWPRAEAAGVRRATFDAACAGLTPDPTAPSASSKQAEFDKPLKAYLTEAVSAARVAHGRAAMARWRGELASISQRFGVPPAIIVAAWGMETDFGAAKGGKDIVRTLATLAYLRQDRALFRDEFIAALVILDKGTVPREKLKGSWAGAMGDPQFIPSAYLKYAASFDGTSFADIWDRPQDSLASIASFLHQSGWRAGLPWGVEVAVPLDFDYRNFDQDFSQWRALGFARLDGEALPAAGPASIYLPAGAKGPAFLISDNFEVIRQYNTSDAYALSVGLLADAIAGRDAPRAAWPKVTPLTTAECKTMQQLLTQRGFYRGIIDGKLGRTSRNAVHAFQLAEGVQPADGFATREIVARLKGP